MKEKENTSSLPEPSQVISRKARVKAMKKEKLPMFARSVSMRLKSDSVPEFTRTITTEVLPLLRKQDGFQDEITLVEGGTQALAISFWEKKEQAESYDHNSYPQVVKALAKVVEGTPKVETYEVCNSTVHEIAAK